MFINKITSRTIYGDCPTRTVGKISARTILQFMNVENEKPVGGVEYALLRLRRRENRI